MWRKWKGKPQTEKIFTIYVSDKELISKIYKRNSHPRNKKGKQPKTMEWPLDKGRLGTANKHTNKYTVSLVTKEMQSKATVTTPKVPKIKMTSKIKCWWACGETKLSNGAGATTWKSWHGLKRKHTSICNPATLLHSIYQREMKIHGHKNTCPRMFRAAPFIK